MSKTTQTLGIVLLSAAHVWGQVSGVPEASGQPQEFAAQNGGQAPIEANAFQDLLDLEFKLDPVELAINEELKLAKKQYESQQWEKAIRSTTEFLAEHPNHLHTAAALFIRGESHVQIQQYSQTRADFTALLKHNPNTVQRARAEFRIAEVAMLTGKYHEAKVLFEDFRSRYPNDQLNAYVLVYLGEIVSRNDAPAAKKLFVEALQGYPGGPLSRRARLHLALLRYRDGNYDSAMRDLTELVETGLGTDSEYWVAWYWLARAELQKNHVDEAIHRLQYLVEQQPQHELAPVALYQAAIACRHHAELERAVRLFERVQDEYADSPYMTSCVIASLRLRKQQGDWQVAMNRFQNLPPSLDSTTKMLATQIATEILIGQQKYSQAESLIAPWVATPHDIQGPSKRAMYYANLFLQALARRGQGKFRSARELLGRIRRDAVPPDLAQRVMLARMETWIATGDYDAAIQAAIEFETLYHDGDLLPAVQEQMVRCFVALKRFDEAQSKLHELQQSHGASAYVARAAEWVAEDAYARGDYETAGAAFELIKSTQTTDESLVRALTGLAWTAQKQAQHDEAAQHFERLLHAFPKHHDIGKVRLAYADTLAALNRNDQAIRILEPFLELPTAHEQRARGLFQLAQLVKQDPQQARRTERLLTEILNSYPDFEMRDAVLYLSGMRQRQAKQWSQAELAFGEIVQKHPDSRYWSDALYRLAESAHQQQQHAVAKRYLTQLISAERDQNVMPHALFMQGRIQSGEKHWDAARRTLRQLLRDYPASELRDVARYGVAESYFQEKEFDRAQQLFQILDQQQRFETGDAWGAMVQLRLAQLAVHRKQPMDAIAIAEKIRTDYPTFSLMHEVDYLIGRTLAARGEFSNSRAAYQRVVSADPTYQREITAMAQWMIGETFFHQKQYILAIKAYEALVADLRFPNWQAASHLQIGKCYELIENLEQAETSYSWVTTQFPESKWAEEAEHRLKQVAQTE